MEFDKSKVYTALNADKLKPGSKVIFANSMQTLKNTVERVVDTLHILKGICDESYPARFYDGSTNWYLAYLVSEPEEKKLKWTDLKIGDVIKNKKENRTAMVIQIDEDCTDLIILAGSKWLNNDELEAWEKVEEETK